MVIFRFFSIILPLFFAVQAELVYAQSSPDLLRWTKEVSAKVKNQKVVTFPRKILLISGWESKYFPELADISWGSGGMLAPVSQSDLAWSFGLNVYPGSPPPKELSLEKRTIQSMLVTGSNAAIVFPSSGKKWRLVYWNGSRVTLNRKEKGGGSISAGSIKPWLRKIFGYDAVILDTKGEFLLVGNLLNGFDGNALQGLVAADSAGKARAKGKSEEGIGLISYVSGRGKFAIFRVVFKEKGVGSIPVGSKVILEKVGG